MKYRAEIDGLRALAVVPVILFHAGFELFSGGFAGVDVFFVISGYLITTILIEDIENKRFSLVNFYERRARRILPALFFVMLVCIPFAWMWSFNQQYKEFSQSLVAVSLFASNILFWRKTDYFSTATDEKPMLHTWSLAVEEQYYVLFPIFLILAWRFGKNRVFWMIVVMAAMSLLLSEWGWRKQTTANFYLAPTRAWELFAGSIAAFMVRKQGVQKNNLLALLGLAAIVFSIFFYDETTPFPSVYTLVPVLGVVLLVLYADKETFASKLLSTKVFVGVGLISYSAYLWHQPLLAFARWRNYGNDLTTNMSTWLILMNLVLAILTYQFIETPIRKKTFLSSRKAIFTFSILGFALFISVGLSGHFYYQPGHQKHPSFIQSIVLSDDYEADNYYLIAESWELQKQVNGIEFFGVDNVAKDRELLFPETSNRGNLLVVGNSHSVDFFNVLSFSEIISSNFNLARFGVQIKNVDDEFYSSPNYQAADVVVLCSLMGDEDLNVLLMVSEQIINDGKRLIICENIFTWMERSNYTKLDRLIIEGSLQNLDIHQLSDDINEEYTRAFQALSFVSADRKSTYIRMKNLLEDMSLKLDFTVIDRMTYVCFDGTCEIVSPTLGKYFFDMGHHTLLGAEYFSEILDTSGIADEIISRYSNE